MQNINLYIKAKCTSPFILIGDFSPLGALPRIPSRSSNPRRVQEVLRTFKRSLRTTPKNRLFPFLKAQSADGSFTDWKLLSNGLAPDGNGVF